MFARRAVRALQPVRRLQAFVPAASLSSIGVTLSSLSAEIPHKSTVRFDKGNLKWTRTDLDLQTMAFAAALVETGYAAGDVVAAMLPTSDPEYHVTQIACARAGLIFADVDPSIAPAKLVDVLLESGAKALIFTPETEGRDNFELLRRMVPELPIYDDFAGVPFHSRVFKNLRECIHTGYDNVPNFNRYKDTLLYQRTAAFVEAQNATKADTPCYIKYDADGKKGKLMSQKDVLAGDVFPLATAALVKQEHIEL